MQYRRPPRRFTPEAVENMRFRYEETNEPQQSIAADYNIHRKTLDRIARDEGWTLRKNRLPHDIPNALRIEAEAERALRAQDAALIEAAAGETQASATQPAPSIADRLAQEIEKELAAVERKRARLGADQASVGDSEKTARILASLTDTLFKIQRLRGSDVSPASTTVATTYDDDLPADIDAFRLALAQRIETFVRSRTDAGLSDAGEPCGAAPA
jgi:hypothetical protein